jgi:hypothetical protein
MATGRRRTEGRWQIRVADTGYLRADGGLTEILDAVRVLRNVAPCRRPRR